MKRELVVIVPSRGRPLSIVALGRTWQETGARADLVVAVDSDDETLDTYANATLGAEAALRIVSSTGMGAALNAVALEYAEKSFALAFLGDDHRPRTSGWDARLVEALRELGTGIVYGNDLLQGEKMATAVAMTSDIVLELGYMAPPALAHLNFDIVWVEWGRAIDRLRYLEDVVIEHMHPAVGKAELDEGYVRVNSAEQVERDGAAFASYHETGAFDADVAKLSRLVG